MNNNINCYPLDDEIDLSIDHIVTNNLEQALLLTNLFEESCDLFNLGLDPSHHSNKLDPTKTHLLDQQWWTTIPIEHQSYPTNTTLLPFDLESNQTHTKFNLNQPITSTSSAPDVLDPTLNGHHQQQSIGPTQSNLIESWIDFTGGGSGANTSTDEPSPTQPIDTSPTELISHSIPSLPIDDDCSSRPQPSTIRDGVGSKTANKNTSKRRISSVSTSSSSITSTSVLLLSSSSSSTSSSCSSFSSSSISGETRDTTDTNPRKTKTNKRNDFLERNRLAASRSRAKKKSYQRHLEEESQRLESEQIKLHQIIQDLMIEKENLKALVNQKFNFHSSQPS